jgi:hypothetical protein
VFGNVPRAASLEWIALAEDATQITFAELRMAVARLLDAAERRFGPSLQLDADHYWSIYPSDAFDLGSDPPILAGQLSDDVASVREVLHRHDTSEDEMLLWHDLDHLTGILQRIANLSGAE